MKIGLHRHRQWRIFAFCLLAFSRSPVAEVCRVKTVNARLVMQHLPHQDEGKGLDDTQQFQIPQKGLMYQMVKCVLVFVKQGQTRDMEMDKHHVHVKLFTPQHI